MDNAGPSPPKRPRTIDFLTSQLEKPVRYFPFNRKLSGILHPERLGRVECVQTFKGQHVISSSSPFSSTMKFVPNKEANISNKLQKLKLKSPDGRDLGEINVQLLPQKGEGIGGKTIMLQKHSLFGKLDNPSAVSILKPVERTKQVTIKGSVSVVQTTGASAGFVNSESNCVSVNSIRSINSVKETGTTRPILNVKHKIDTQRSSLLLKHSDISKYSSPSLGSKVFFINIDKQTGLNTVKSINNDARNSASNQKIIVVHAENYPDSTEGKKNNGLGTTAKMRVVSSSKDETSTELTSSTSNVRTIPSVFWNPSKFPELTSKLITQKSKGNENVIVKSSGNTTSDKSMILSQCVDNEQVKTVSKNSTPATSSFQKKQNPKLNSWTIVKTSSKKLENGKNISCENDGKESQTNNVEISRISQTQNISHNYLNSENTQNVTSTTNNISHPADSKQCDENLIANTQKENLKEKSNNDQKLRENIMVILHNDMNTLKNSEKNISEPKVSNKKVINMEVDAGTKVDANVTRDKNVVKMNTEVSSKVLNPVPPDQSSKKDSTADIISPKQPDLDIIQKALSSCMDHDLRNKALKALAECVTGVKRDVPVPPIVSVRDSQTQTQVFCLLEPKVLVEYSESSPILNTLNVVNRSEKSTQCPHNLPLSNEPQLTNNDYYMFDDILPADILSVFDGVLTDDSMKGVSQVNNILSKPNPIVSRAFMQIQKDIQAATTVDANGMMGIHRAVLSGDVKEVQRQLIVLKAVKESIEVPNGDRKTSLELAVLHSVDSSIVQALLAAGAKPAFPIKLHESALIIASRTSSAVLPELIKHVTPSSLLDIMDSEGFAPLHYCAQLGNIEGIKALVSAGALVNLRDAKSGRTALFHALEIRNMEMAWYLVENGASPNIVNFAGQSPGALVDEYRHNSFVEKFNAAVR